MTVSEEVYLSGDEVNKSVINEGAGPDEGPAENEEPGENEEDE